MLSSTINISSHLVLVSGGESVNLIDPKTSSVLQTFKTPSKAPLLSTASSAYGYVLTASPDKNFIICYDFKGVELWKQNIGGQALLEILTHNDIVMGFQKNKEVRIWSALWEKKTELVLESAQIDLVRHSSQYVAVSDNLSLSIYVYLIEDIICSNSTTKYIRKLCSHSEIISDMSFGPIGSRILYSVAADKKYSVWDLDQEQMERPHQGILEYEPKCCCADKDGDYLFVGLANGQIQKIKLNNNQAVFRAFPHTKSNGDQEFRIEKDRQTKIVLSGHASEVTALKFFISESQGVLISGSADGQVFFWDIWSTGKKDFQPTIIKKMITLSTRPISRIILIPRPREYMQECEDLIFKFKRSITLKPLKKSDVDDSKGVHLTVMNNKKFIKEEKRRLKCDIFKMALVESGVEKNQSLMNDSQFQKMVEQILEENRKLKQINFQLFSQNTLKTSI